MSYQLFFKPIAQPRESAGSLLLRLSEAHTERPTGLFSEFGFPQFSVSGTLRKTYAGISTELSPHIDITNWRYSPHTKTITSGRNSKSWIDFKNAKVCLDCAKEGYLPETHDYHLITCCTKHHKLLATHCNHCNENLRWNRYGLARCHCFGLIEYSQPADSDHIAITTQLEAWITSGDTEKLIAYESLLSTLNTRISTTERWEFSAIEYVEGNVAPLAHALKPYHLGSAPLTARVIVGTLALVPSTSVRLAMPALITAIEEVNTSSETKALRGDFHLTRSELLFAFGCKPDTVDILLSKSLKNKAVPGSVRKRQVMLNELKRLYSYFTAECPVGMHTITLAQLAALSRKKVGILVGEVLDGKLSPAGAASWRLSDLRVEMHTEYINEVPEGFSTLKQAQQIMQLNSEYIAGFRRSGLLSEHRQANKNNRYLYRTNDLYAFKKRYISASEIAKGIRCPVTVITDKLRFMNVKPISGPGIDSSVVFLFERKDIESIDLSQALSVTDSYSMSGRKAASAPRLDGAKWMTSAEAAETLGLSIQQLFQLVNQGLLVATRPANAPSTEKHYFQRENVDELTSYIAEMQDVSNLARKFGVTKLQILTRVYRLLKSKPIKLKNQLVIGLDEANALERHFSLYLDAVQAAAILDAKPRDIHNWKRLGHLSPITDKHPGYIQGPTLFDAAHISEFTRPQ
jgi:DNA-binding transcriptional MerR regulator